VLSPDRHHSKISVHSNSFLKRVLVFGSAQRRHQNGHGGAGTIILHTHPTGFYKKVLEQFV
jgi:hypothetical protein